MKTIGIVGYSGSGKTTLVENLVERLRERGRVATIKSIKDDIEIDEEGKDTYRHRMAGAEKVVGVTPSITFEISQDGKSGYKNECEKLSRILNELSEDGFDYVVVEGFKNSDIPKIIVGDLDESDVHGEIIDKIDTSAYIDFNDLIDKIQDL
ncbi:MAG: molybdopterin-guanine dinucleotide biosynthesis protein B [Halobacteria archaeon]|nr:molybdopterin-guanine dinucleotide biosynthesis protein B [Halobacteria archaeon]